MLRKWATTAAAITMAFTGCSDSTGPRPFAGTYVLAEIDGTGTLVLVDHVSSNGERIVYSIVYDTIQFTSATAARRSESFQAIRYDIAGTPLQVYAESATYTGEVHRDGNVVGITWNKPTGPSFHILVNVDGTLESETTNAAMVCVTFCPPPRTFVFTYARP